VTKPEKAAAAYISSICVELRALASQHNLRLLEILLEAAILQAGIAEFDPETRVGDDG
jgi:hypothetical protein